WGTAQVLNMLGDLARSQGDEAGARARYEEALALLRGRGLPGTVPSLLHNLGYLASRQGDTRRALRLFRESLALFRDQGDQRGIADCLTGLAGSLGAMKQPERAVRLLGAADALREVTGAAVWPANAADYDRSLRLVRGQLGEAAFVLKWTAGRALPLERAIAEALAAEPASNQSGGIDGLDLTPRELEVVTWIAQGLTNRQIGATLFITEGTARLHVKHILGKLGFTSRAQIAGWAVDRGLAGAPEAR
ncbi:MAG TPA: LuxR C-terminal-related transcriptional regulator, partial [Chloroflexota bacterium]|nr:LuxR C-terminal-related transcriptional regulator [Chloroflexota bacterium]